MQQDVAEAVVLLPEEGHLAWSTSVGVRNRPTETSIPGLALKLKPGKNIWYDWWHYGGIVRDVWLTESEGIVIRRQQIRPDSQHQSCEAEREERERQDEGHVVCAPDDCLPEPHRIRERE